jgi:hypothetical protein
MMQNPYSNPLDKKTGFMHELLNALSPEELRQYINHFQWRQAHEVFPEKPRNMYQSKAYFMLRTNQFIHDAKLVLAEQGEIKSDGSEVIDHEE